MLVKVGKQWVLKNDEGLTKGDTKELQDKYIKPFSRKGLKYKIQAYSIIKKVGNTRVIDN